MAEEQGYKIIVSLGKGYPTWAITDSDNCVVDNCYRYSPTLNELAARVQAEKALSRILNKN